MQHNFSTGDRPPSPVVKRAKRAIVLFAQTPESSSRADSRLILTSASNCCELAKYSIY
ncbi:hypothetical protein [Microcoleus sp.]|uniref:hypothetical protein n=1 Tax=Microcoleus sp. TaxID=44472 RepID=UPI003593E63D